MSGFGALSEDAHVVWEESLLGRWPPDVRERLLDGSRELALAPGSFFYRGRFHEETEKVGLVLDGLLRTFRRAPDGRQVTLRYASRGRVIGLPTALGRQADVDAEALLASRVVVLDARTFRAVAAEHPAVSWDVAVYLAALVQETQNILVAHMFLPIRSRVARHLLDMSVHRGEQLVVTASQQDLADAIGSVREVVGRALAEFAAEGHVERQGRLLVLRDPRALHEISLG